jgi:HEPN domain-containing protein
VDENKRNTIAGWIEKASNHLNSAREHLKSGYRASESIQASPVCIELSVKAILSMLDIEFPLTHGWDRKQMAQIAKRMQERDLLNRLKAQSLDHDIRLPRLIFRANFWSQFYLETKYGIEAEHLAPAQELFEIEDAQLAVRHAEACLIAAQTLLFLPQERLATLTDSQPR